MPKWQKLAPKAVKSYDEVASKGTTPCRIPWFQVHGSHVHHNACLASQLSCAVSLQMKRGRGSLQLNSPTFGFNQLQSESNQFSPVWSDLQETGPNFELARSRNLWFPGRRRQRRLFAGPLWRGCETHAAAEPALGDQVQRCLRSLLVAFQPFWGVQNDQRHIFFPIFNVIMMFILWPVCIFSYLPAIYLDFKAKMAWW